MDPTYFVLDCASDEEYKAIMEVIDLHGERALTVVTDLSSLCPCQYDQLPDIVNHRVLYPEENLVKVASAAASSKTPTLTRSPPAKRRCLSPKREKRMEEREEERGGGEEEYRTQREKSESRGVTGMNETSTGSGRRANMVPATLPPEPVTQTTQSRPYGYKLYEYIIELLMDPAYHHIVRFTGKPNPRTRTGLEFTIIDRVELARMWGEYKRMPNYNPKFIVNKDMWQATKNLFMTREYFDSDIVTYRFVDGEAAESRLARILHKLGMSMEEMVETARRYVDRC